MILYDSESSRHAQSPAGKFIGVEGLENMLQNLFVHTCAGVMDLDTHEGLGGMVRIVKNSFLVAAVGIDLDFDFPG